MIEVDELFPERDEPDDAMTEAIAAACARLGRAAEVTTANGELNTVVAAALDGERVAWVEQRWRNAGYEDIEGYTLWACGATEWGWEVDTYNPWFGCTVHWMRWFGDSLVVVYSEKHRTIACALDREGAPRMRVVSSAWQIVGDTLLFASEARGLVERVSLPELVVWAPLPADAAARELSAGTCSPPASLVEGTPAFWREVARRLPAVDERLVEVLIGSLAYRFWQPRPPVTTSYEQAYAARDEWNSPCWLAFDWVRSRGEAEMHGLIADLEAIAGRAAVGCGVEEMAAELAARHIAGRCSELAAACRVGRLPEGVSSYFWAPWSQAGFAGAERLFPAGMWAAWLELRESASGRC